jgi:D-3-phosphoglycerate dehydrogenase
MKIAILDDFQDAVRQLECFKLLSALPDSDVKVFTNTAKGVGQLAIRLASFDAIVAIGERTHFSRPLFARLPKLKLIAQAGKVGPHIDLAAATDKRVAVADGIVSPVAPAELTWALIMAASRRINPYANNLRDGLWQMASINPILNGIGTGLRGRVLGIWGYGRVGKIVAGYGRAFGMRVLVWGGEETRAAALRDDMEVAESRAHLFDKADVLTLHLPLVEATRAIVTAEDFARMKPTAWFVNTSHAALVAENALEEALHRGRPFGAAVDVFASEPAANAALLKIPTVLATPHIGYVEKDNYEIAFEAAFRNVLAFAEGKPDNIVNPDALAA